MNASDKPNDEPEEDYRETDKKLLYRGLDKKCTKAPKHFKKIEMKKVLFHVPKEYEPDKSFKSTFKAPNVRKGASEEEIAKAPMKTVEF